MALKQFKDVLFYFLKDEGACVFLSLSADTPNMTAYFDMAVALPVLLLPVAYWDVVSEVKRERSVLLSKELE